MLIKINEFLRDSKGQALVELALILPILLMLLFGTIEFGRVFNTYLTVTSVSREGARAATVGADNNEIMEKVRAGAPNLDSSKLSIEISPEFNRSRGDSVIVTVEYPVTLYAPLIDIAIDNPMLVINQTTMRME